MIIDEETNTVRKSDYELVEKVEALDPHTLSVTYKEPFSPAPRLTGRDLRSTPA
jgi:ABC-type transport system substrate-binding protein